MRRKLSATIAFGLVMATSRLASAAAVLTTPEVYGGSGELKACTVINVGTKPVTISVEIIREDGAPFMSNLKCTLQAGQADGGCNVTDFAIGGNYCRITVVKGSKKDIQAAIDLSTAGTSRLVVPAR